MAIIIIIIIIIKKAAVLLQTGIQMQTMNWFTEKAA